MQQSSARPRASLALGILLTACTADKTFNKEVDKTANKTVNKTLDTTAGRGTTRGGVGVLPAVGHIDEDAQSLLCNLKRAARHSMWSTDETLPWRYERKRRLYKSWNTCAVVSSGGVLNQYEYGSDIDSAELVIRFNGAPVNGFEKFVGGKTGMRIVNNEYFKHVWIRGFCPACLDQVYPQQEFAMDVDKSYVCVWDDWSDAFHYWDFLKIVPSTHREVEVDLLSSSVHESLTREIRYFYSSLNLSAVDGTSWIPSTGALGMYAALVICDEVYAYGMADTKLTRTSANHYYEPWSEKPTWHKTWDLEKDLWRRLASDPPAWDVESTDLAIIPGLSSISCPGDWDDWEPVGFHEEPILPSWDSVVVRVAMAALTPLVLWFTARMLLRPDSVSRDLPQLNMPAVGALLIYSCCVAFAHVCSELAARRNGGSFPWDEVMLVLLTDLCKAAISASLIAVGDTARLTRVVSPSRTNSSSPIAAFTSSPSPHGIDSNDGSDDDEESEDSMHLWMVAAWRLMPSAALYTFNSLYFGSLCRGMLLREYLVWFNFNIVFNTILWKACFRGSLRKHQWIGLSLVFLGGVLRLFPLGRRGPISLALWECISCLLTPLMSALATVLNEDVLKDPELIQGVGLDCLNLIMYSQQIVMLLVAHVWICNLSGANFFWQSPLQIPLFFMVAVGTLLGLALSRILAYVEAGSVARGIVGSTRDLGSVLIAPLGKSSWEYVICQLCSVVWVACGIGAYFLPWLTVHSADLLSSPAVGRRRFYDDE